MWASLVAQLVKNLPAMLETWVWSLGWEDSLEKGTATHSSILAWRIPGMGEPGGLPSMGSHRIGYDWSDLALDGETMETVTVFIFFSSKITADGDCSHEIKRCLPLGKKTMTHLPRQCIKKQRHHFANKGPYSQSCGFSSSHVQMWKLDHKEGWAPKNWCFWIVVLEKTLESSLDCKRFKPVNPKGNQPWIFIERTDAKTETPILWLPDVKSWLVGKDTDVGKRLRAGGEGGNRGWDYWMASPTQWTWVWANSRR